MFNIYGLINNQLSQIIGNFSNTHTPKNYLDKIKVTTHQVVTLTLYLGECNCVCLNAMICGMCFINIFFIAYNMFVLAIDIRAKEFRIQVGSML